VIILRLLLFTHTKRLIQQRDKERERGWGRRRRRQSIFDKLNTFSGSSDLSGVSNLPLWSSDFRDGDLRERHRMSEQEEGGKGTGILTFFAISFFEAGEVTEDKENSLNTLRRARGGAWAGLSVPFLIWN
jgi:hypothetical protein